MKFCVYKAEVITFLNKQKNILHFFYFFEKGEKFLTKKTLDEFSNELQHSDEEG